MPYHTVVQGEHITRITVKYGFKDFHTIWDQPENAELRQKRNPNVLLPGDRIFIPERKEKRETAATEQRHRFQAKGLRVMLRIIVRDVNNKPVSSTECRLEVEGQAQTLATDDKGKIERSIPADAEKGKLTVPSRKLEFPLRIGHLDPVTESSGQRARLDNMGYYAGFEKTDEQQLRWAVEEFQCNNNLRPVSGECDARTQEKLKSVYGC